MLEIALPVNQAAPHSSLPNPWNKAVGNSWLGSGKSGDCRGEKP